MKYVERIVLNEDFNMKEAFLKEGVLFVKAINGKKLSEVYSIMYDEYKERWYIHNYQYQEPIERILLMDDKLWIDDNINIKEEVKKEILENLK